MRKIQVVLISIVIIFLISACGGANSAARSTATPTLAPIKTAVPSETPTPTATTLPTPDLPEGGQAVVDEHGLEIASSPDRGSQWLVEPDHPVWPLFIQNEDGSWREVMKYIEVTHRLTEMVDEELGQVPLALRYQEDPSSYGVSIELFPVIAGELVKGEDDLWRLPLAIPLDGNQDSPMLTFNAVLGYDTTTIYLNTYSEYQYVFQAVSQTSMKRALEAIGKADIGNQIRVRSRQQIYDWDKFKKEIIDQGRLGGGGPGNMHRAEWTRDFGWLTAVISEAIFEHTFVDVEETGAEIWSTVLVGVNQPSEDE